MPAKSKSAGGDSVRELLHGGKKVPQALLRQHMADLKRDFEARYKQKSALQQQANKYLAEIQKATAKPAPEGAEVTRAMNGLRAMTERLANRKLSKLAVAPEILGILAGSYTLQITPPYDYSSYSTSVGFGHPTLSASADENSGQMSCSVATDFKAKSGGQVFSSIGIYFSPMFQSGSLRATINPAFVFSWWANSLASQTMVLPADSLASGSLGITAYKGTAVDGQSVQDFALWQEFIAGDLEFDFGSTNRSLSTQMNVNGSHSYVISLSCTCLAEAGGWPGSLAGATLNTALPSITLDVQLGQPYAENA